LKFDLNKMLDSALAAAKDGVPHGFVLLLVFMVVVGAVVLFRGPKLISSFSAALLEHRKLTHKRQDQQTKLQNSVEAIKQRPRIGGR
jgi:hypothetical protein